MRDAMSGRRRRRQEIDSFTVRESRSDSFLHSVAVLLDWYGGRDIVFFVAWRYCFFTSSEHCSHFDSMLILLLGQHQPRRRGSKQ
jgi:hypothetical protein